jgi:O-antigen ligase
VEERLLNTQTPQLSVEPAVRLSAAWLAVGLVALPWLYRISWDTPRVAIVLPLGPAVWLGRSLITRRIERLVATGSRISLVAVVLIAAVLFSIVGSPHWAASLTTAATWCLLALTATLVAELVEERGGASHMLLGALVVSVATATVAHWLRWKTGHSEYTAFYDHPRLMGLHGLAGAFAAIAMVSETWRRDGKQRWFWLGAGTLAWAGLLWSGSRSPLVGIAAGLAVWTLKLRGRERRRLVLTTGALCLAGMLLSRLFWTPASGLGWWNVAHRTALTQSTVQLTSNRSSFWSDAATHIPASPWIGYGPDAYSFLTPQLEGAQPHNLELQLLLDVGAPGAIAALSLIGWCLWRGWKGKEVAGAACAAWLAIAIGSVTAAHLDGYFYYPLASIAAWLALGACAAGESTMQPTLLSASPRTNGAWIWAPPAWLAGGILVLNCWLFNRVAHGAPPARPDALLARVWQAFPSVTYNIDLWIDAWARRYPDDALALSRFARRHSQSPDLFRVKTAELLMQRGDSQGALAELELARFEARPEQRPAIDVLLQRARRATASP